MLRPELLRRWSLAAGASVLLCLALLGTGARASMPPVPELRAAAAATMPSTGTPMASDGMPCALCFVAAAPSPQTFAGEGKEPEPLTWWVHAQPTPSEARFRVLDIAPREHVPIRVAFCRWLD